VVYQTYKLSQATGSKNDYSIFLKAIGTHLTIVVVYVDDILVTGSNINEVKLLKQHLIQPLA